MKLRYDEIRKKYGKSGWNLCCNWLGIDVRFFVVGEVSWDLVVGFGLWFFFLGLFFVIERYFCWEGSWFLVLVGR